MGLIGDGLPAILRSLDVILLALASIGGLKHGRDMISTVERVPWLSCEG